MQKMLTLSDRYVYVHFHADRAGRGVAVACRKERPGVSAMPLLPVLLKESGAVAPPPTSIVSGLPTA
jgi:hypothetical protein